MPEATLKLVAKLVGVAPVTVSRVVNGSENAAAATRENILVIIRDLDYAPNIHATNLRRKRLTDQSGNGAERLVSTNKRLRAKCGFNVNGPWKPEAAFAEQIICLRRDLDKLRKHTERIQTYLDIIQEVCSRRLSSCATR